jgi:hypothetical protein
MSDPFNSPGGYTVGIPPIQVVAANGAITSDKANFGNVAMSGNLAVSGAITATNFYGSLIGNINANITVSGSNGAVLFNDNGLAVGADGVVYNKGDKSLTVENDLAAKTFTLGLAPSQFYEISSQIATTSSTSANQVLHRTYASSIIAVDYTIIATNTVLNYRQVSKLDAAILGSTVEYAEFGTVDLPQSSPGVADFRVSFESGGGAGNVVLTATPVATDLTEYKILITKFKE